MLFYSSFLNFKTASAGLDYHFFFFFFFLFDKKLSITLHLILEIFLQKMLNKIFWFYLHWHNISWQHSFDKIIIGSISISISLLIYNVPFSQLIVGTYKIKNKIQVFKEKTQTNTIKITDSITLLSSNDITGNHIANENILTATTISCNQSIKSVSQKLKI